MVDRRIAVVDDDADIRNLLTRYLTEQGYSVSPLEGGKDLMALLEVERVDLVLLDLMMPEVDGLHIARDVRKKWSTPIIFLTGKGDLIDVVVGLEIGADDYITKPFQLREVLARVRCVLRRTCPEDGAASLQKRQGVEQYGFGGMRFDVGDRSLRLRDGTKLPLTTGEFDLLHAFVSHPQEPLSRDRLMELTKGRQWSPIDRSIDTQVTRLRKKIEYSDGGPELIKTVRGLGYVFSADVQVEIEE